GTEHRRIIAVEREHQAFIEITAYRMPLDSFATSGADITGHADFNRDLALRQLFDQLGIARSGECVADALGFQIERSPDRFRSGVFSGVRREMQSMIGGTGEGILE